MTSGQLFIEIVNGLYNNYKWVWAFMVVDQTMWSDCGQSEISDILLNGLYLKYWKKNKKKQQAGIASTQLSQTIHQYVKYLCFLTVRFTNMHGRTGY